MTGSELSGAVADDNEMVYIPVLNKVCTVSYIAMCRG